MENVEKFLFDSCLCKDCLLFMRFLEFGEISDLVLLFYFILFKSDSYRKLKLTGLQKFTSLFGMTT